MHPFVMISKAYTDGVSLRKEGPKTTRSFSSESVLVDDRTFRTGALFVPGLVPSRYITTLTVGEGLTFYESVSFERRTVMKNHSETVNVFAPRDVARRYRSTLRHEPDATGRRYTVGVELLPARKCRVEQRSECEIRVADEDCASRRGVNGDVEGNPPTVNGSLESIGTRIGNQNVPVAEILA